MSKLISLLALVIVSFCTFIAYIKFSSLFLAGFYGPSIRLFVIGDYGEFHPKWKFPILPVKRNADAMNELGGVNTYSMILTLGDNFYSQEVMDFFKTINRVFNEVFVGEHIKNLPWYLSYGNHDYYYSKNYGELLSEIYSNVNMPSGPWNLTLQMEGFKVDFIFLPCDIVCHGNSTNHNSARQCHFMHSGTNHTETYFWLETHLQDINDDEELVWKIVIIHYPLFSVSVTGMDSENLKTNLLPILRQYKVDMVLSGHNHNMQYFYSDHEKHADYKEQELDEKCLPETDIMCEGHKIHCYFKNVSCYDGSHSCINKISVEESNEFLNFTRSYTFTKGKGLHQVVQGSGGADLNPICPGMSSPMAENLFAMSTHGFSDLFITRASLKIRYLASDTSIVFESTITSE